MAQPSSVKRRLRRLLAAVAVTGFGSAVVVSAPAGAVSEPASAVSGPAGAVPGSASAGSESSYSAAIPAFPGAEGFGAYASGGRGGTVYYVTNLNDSGPGSFRDAVSQPGRTVVFAVGGVISIDSRITVAPNITIAGQTAPGGGITIYGDGLSFTDADNTITRYIRVRQGVGGTAETDAISISRGNTMIFDHVSASWGRDEVFSATVGDLNKPIEEHPRNITIQNTIMGQGLDNHSAGSLMESEGGLSLLRNLYIDNNIRSAKVKGVNQYVNNVVYNWREEAYILGGSQWTSRANVVNSYFISGPETVSPPFVRGNENFQLYAAGNVFDGDRDGALDGYVVPREEYGVVTWVDEPFDYPPVDTMTAEEAYRHVLADVGASKVRDRIDLYMLAELRSLGERGEIISDENAPPINGPGPVPGGQAPLDTDQDGMPDDWEEGAGSDPRTPDNNGDHDGDGYTNLEEYLNQLAG